MHLKNWPRENYSAYIHTEHIGNLSYQSAYVPLLNSENQVFSLPEPTLFYPAGSFGAGGDQPGCGDPEYLCDPASGDLVFERLPGRSGSLSPCGLFRTGSPMLSFSKKNEKIIYRGKDEIHGLVEEYNFMVDELTRSAELLAQSERETAWREMAKQIAHEIKNPLTPMKLNVQHLMRMASEGDENLEDQIEKMSRALIEQIDSLSSIANEFSDFAKMPKAKNQKINLLTKLNNTVQLFQNNDKAEVKLESGILRDLSVFGDPEQLQRLIINLVKNGIQSIPDKRKGIIQISAEMTDDGNALIKVRDNGKGIPDSIQDKLFQPNFTTKGSGMGMGWLLLRVL